MTQPLKQILLTTAPPATLLIRLMVGGVFLSEGIQKFLFPATRGTGRFITIGLPNPDFLGPFVGTFETLCGLAILVGLFTRLAVLPTLAIMGVAIVTTKLPILRNEGFWEMAHAMRTDYSMLLGSLFLLGVGAGPWSLDRFILSKMK